MKTGFPKAPRELSVPKPEVKAKANVELPAVTATTQPLLLPPPSAFTAPPVHATVEKAAPYVAPLNTRAKADPLIGAREARGPRVAALVPVPTRPAGYTPRQIWQGVVIFGTHHEAARALIGDMASVEKLKAAGFDASVAVEWRDFYTNIDRVSAERGSPNPSALGRAEYIDWLVVQLGGKSSGLWKGAAA